MKRAEKLRRALKNQCELYLISIWGNGIMSPCPKRQFYKLLKLFRARSLLIKKIVDNFLDYQQYRFEVVVNPTKRNKLERNETARHWTRTRFWLWAFTNCTALRSELNEHNHRYISIDCSHHQ